MRVYIFEEDSSVLSLLSLYLEGQGHQVSGFSDEYTCQHQQLGGCTCTVENPCADAVIVNARFPGEEEVQLLINYEEKGCKIPRLNKAVMSADLNKDQEQEIRNLGFTLISKPFKLAEINEWLNECKARQS